MVAAPLHRVVRAVHRINGLAKRLAAVDDKQTALIRFHPAFDHVLQERRADRGVLAGAVSQAQNVLMALAIDADRHDHVVNTENDPVEVNDQISWSSKRRSINSFKDFSDASTNLRLT